MTNEKNISEHYLHGDLLKAIQAGIIKIGKTTDTITIEDLAPVDEFHIGGRLATDHFISQLNLSETGHVLDVGCGLGGASRFVANKYNNHVTGIDLSHEYIETGNTLCTWVKLDQHVSLQQGSALSMPFQDKTFDGAYMMHVGMNIEDKELLFTEIYRVIRPGSFFGVYDVMRNKDGELAYPVPWAAEKNTSGLATPDQYKHALVDAGFEVVKENNRRDFAMEIINNIGAKGEAKSVPPPLGLHILMKEGTAIKIKNMIDNIMAGYIVPFEIIVQKC